jgi:hypothetical protein
MKRLLVLGILAACALLAVGANAALVRVNGLVLTADGGFTPRMLPQHGYAPIDFRGMANLKAVGGGAPPPLQQLILDFDRDGKLTTAGLPICQPGSLEEKTPEEARSICAAAIVGTGTIEASIATQGGALKAGSPLTLFNGPPQGGNPTVILHARTTVPATQTFVITVPIEQRKGGFRYRATIDVPPIAAGLGSLTHIDAKIGRHYRFHGVERSYTSARCSDGVLRTRGHFAFADGTIIDGVVEKGCTVLK